jgi:epidermal growth factor receptor substrate 15
MTHSRALADPGADQPVLNLTAEEKRVFQHLFQQADTEKLGVITGEIAVKFFERTKLAPAVLGEIWQIADTENRGLLTMAGQVLRLIGHYQAGREPTIELAYRRKPSSPLGTTRH